MAYKVLLLGANGLIGKSIANYLISQGFLVFLADICGENQNFSETSITYIDVCSEDSVKRRFSELWAQETTIDAVIHAAYPKGKGYGKNFESLSLDEFQETVSMQAGSAFLVTKFASTHMIKHGGGSIVHLGSIYGRVAPRFSIYEEQTFRSPVEYSFCKHGLVGLVKYFAAFYKAQGIRVNVVSPGGIYDNHPESFTQKYGRHCGKIGMLSPTDLHGIISLLLSEQGRAITGQDLVIDDGFCL